VGRLAPFRSPEPADVRIARAARRFIAFQLAPGGRIGCESDRGSDYRRCFGAGCGARGQAVTYWNEVVIFSDNLQTYIGRHIGKGDLVHARGRIRQSRFERNGETVYTVDLICNQFARLAAAPEKPESTPEPRAPIGDDEIPY
jgi:hypothetical protein